MEGESSKNFNMPIFPKLTQYKNWLELSWPGETETGGVFFEAIATALNWPDAVTAVAGQPKTVLQALGVKAGDHVVLPNLCTGYWGAAVKSVGADCVLIDVHPQNWQLDLDLLEEFLMNYSMLNERDELLLKKDSRVIRALVIPHLLGGLCDLERLQFIAHRFNLKFAEDISQALGSRWNGRPAGSFGQFGYCGFALNPILPFGQSVIFSSEVPSFDVMTQTARTLPADQLLNQLGRQMASRLPEIIATFQAAERRARTAPQHTSRQWIALESKCESNGLATAFIPADNSALADGGQLPVPLYRQEPLNKSLYIRREDWSGKLYDRVVVMAALS